LKIASPYKPFKHVQAILQREEEAFGKTVEKGMKYFAEINAELSRKGLKIVPGEYAFLLYDTHGFPLDLTQQMAGEAGLEVDVQGFQDAMEEQKACCVPNHESFICSNMKPSFCDLRQFT
jgi:alanyl-tRNA synthetase